MPFTTIYAKTGRRDNNRIGEWFAINGNKRGAPLDGGERNGGNSAKRTRCKRRKENRFQRGKFDFVSTGNVIKRSMNDEMLKSMERFEIM